MWKQCVLLLLSLAAALNCEIWNEPPKKFTAGKAVIFDYDAQILTGVPTTSWHYTGYRLLARVHLLIKNMDTITLRLEQIRFLRINQEITVEEPTVFLPKELFEEMSEEQIARHIEKELQRPIQFSWKVGVVSNVQTDVKDLFWSVNMKKGLLNMLNMDFTPSKKEDRLKWNGNFFQSMYEDGIEGRCRSVYHWNRLPVRTMTEAEEGKEAENTVAITMVKTRDLKDCLDTPVFEHALFLSKDCDERRMNVTRDMIKAEATVRANVTFWKTPKGFFWQNPKSEFFVWEVKGDARYTFAPIHAKLGSISTFVKQNLTFIEERPLEEEMKREDKAEEKVMMRKEESLQMIVPMPEIMPVKNATEEITQVVFNVLKQIRSQIKERDPTLMTLIKKWILLLRQVPKELLEKVHKECSERAREEPEMLALFHDILPSIATKEAVELIVEKAVLTEIDDDISVARRVRKLGMMNHVVHKEIIYKLIEAAKSPILQRKTQRRETLKAIIMTVSSLTKTYIDQRKRPELEFTPEYEEEVAERVFTFLHEMLETQIPSLKEIERMLVVCRAFGNVALPKGLELLTRLIYADKLPLIVRVQCVYALRLYAPEKPEQIRQWTLPLFFDVTKDVELRIASYLITMRTRPTQVLLDSIVENIRREPVMQVQSFVMSHLKNVVESPCHCDCMVVRNISHIVETLRFKEMGAQYSKVHHFPLTETETAVIRTGAIFTPEEFVPRSAHMKILTQGSGREIDILEVGVRTEGLQRMLEKLVGPNGKLFTVSRFQELLKTFEPTEVLSEINLAFYVRLFGEEMNFWALTEESKNIVEEGLNFLPKNFMQFLTGREALPLKFVRTMFTDSVIRVPTVFGLPFTANFSSLIHVHTTGQMVMKRGIFDEEMVHAEIRVTPTVFTQHLLEVGVDATITKAFTQIKVDANIPDVRNIKVNVMFKKTGNMGLRVHVEKPEEDWRLIHINSTMNNVFTEMRGNWVFATERVPMLPKVELFTEGYEPVELPFKPLGLTLKYRMNSSMLHQSRYPILYPLRGHFHFSAVLRNTDNRREGIELRIVRDRSEDETKQTTQKDEINMKKLFKIQLLRTKLRTEMNEERDEETTSEKGETEERPINRRLLQERRVKPIPEDKETDGDTERETNKERLIAEVSFMGNSTRKHQCNFRVVFKTGRVFGQEKSYKFTLKGIAILPKNFNVFNKENPLRIETESREDSRLFVKCTLVDEKERELLQFKTTFDTDEFAVRFFKRMGKNMEKYRALHPMVNQCYMDMRQKYTNTPACYLTQRYMTMFNRQNYTLIVPANAPAVVKRIITWIANEKMRLLSRFMPEVKIINADERDFYLHKEMRTRNTDDADMNEESDTESAEMRGTEENKSIPRRNRHHNRQDTQRTPMESDDTVKSRFEEDDTLGNRRDNKKNMRENRDEEDRTTTTTPFERDDTLKNDREEEETTPNRRDNENNKMRRNRFRNYEFERQKNRRQNGEIETEKREDEVETPRRENARNVRSAKVYHVSFVASPFDLRVMSVNYLLDTILLRFDNVIVPSTWFTHMHTADRFYATVMGMLTQERYPPVCRIRTTPNRAVHVMTFDGLLFNANTAFPMKQRRVILTQDIRNRFQVSAASFENEKEIQIITRDFNRRVQLVRTPGTEKIRVLIDGKETRNLPLTLTNEKKQVILKIEQEEVSRNEREQVIRVEFPLLGVILTTDVDTVFDTEVSPFFHTTLRGVCGDFDGERRTELKTRDCKKFFVRPQEVFYSKEFTMETRSIRDEPHMLPLNVCKREQLLTPFLMRTSRSFEDQEDQLMRSRN